MTAKLRFNQLFAGILVAIGLIPLFYFLSIEIGIAQAANEYDADSLIEESSIDRYIENVAFGVNEKLSFDINYGFINAGTASMEIPRIIEYEGRPCYQIITRAESNSFFSNFFKVDDRVESIIDAVGLFSWRFEKNLKEGNYRSDRMHVADQRNHLVYYKEDTVEVAPYVQDALSVLYYIRTQNLEIGKSVFVENFIDGKKYPLEVKIVKKEKVKVAAGSFDCIVVEPLLQSVGIFKHEGKLTVWLTDDRLKMPVQMKSKVLVGSITAELTDFQLGDIEVF